MGSTPPSSNVTGYMSLISSVRSCRVTIPTSPSPTACPSQLTTGITGHCDPINITSTTSSPRISSRPTSRFSTALTSTSFRFCSTRCNSRDAEIVATVLSDSTNTSVPSLFTSATLPSGTPATRPSPSTYTPV